MFIDLKNLRVDVSQEDEDVVLECLVNAYLILFHFLCLYVQIHAEILICVHMCTKCISVRSLAF